MTPCDTSDTLCIFEYIYYLFFGVLEPLEYTFIFSCEQKNNSFFITYNADTLKQLTLSPKLHISNKKEREKPRSL